MHSPREFKFAYVKYFTQWNIKFITTIVYTCVIADQKAALQEILMHHQNNQYPSNLLPPSPRALPSAATDPLLLTPVLTSHLTSGTSSLPTQPQIGSSLVPLSHEHSPAGINTLYSSLQSAPKKRKLSQDGLIHVKQVFSRFGYLYYKFFVKLLFTTLFLP